MRRAHPDCEVCAQRKARVAAVRARYLAAMACLRCGTPVRRYKLCAACRQAQQASQRGVRARRAHGTH